MIKLKIITRSFIYLTSVLLLSAYTVGITENQIIIKENKQSIAFVPGIYEFQMSWLQSAANFKSDGTFEMSYTLSDKHETSGTWTIKKDILILKNDDNFPANKKWLIRDEKLYPILKSSKEYNMDYYYILQKQPTEKVIYSSLKNCKLKYSDSDDNSTYIIIKDNIHTEFPDGGKNYIKSKLEWINDFEYNATVIELTASDLSFKVGDKINVKFDKFDNETVYYTASFEGSIVTGKFKIIN